MAPLSEPEPDLILFAKPGCHLCEEARELVQLTLPGMTLVEVDISTDARLQSKYGYTIPVLHRRIDGVELNWPFGPADLVDWKFQGL